MTGGEPNGWHVDTGPLRPRLVAIELEGFRGFAERQRLSLDADAVVLRGDNGTGKTSVVDGLLWLFTGELEHLTRRVKGLRKGEDAVTNRYVSTGARVRLEVRIDGQAFAFTRTGDQRNTELAFERPGAVTAQDAVDDGRLGANFAGSWRHVATDPERMLALALDVPGADALRQAVSGWGILRQDHIRATLDAGGGPLHQRLAGIVGLDDVSSFAQASSQAARALIQERTAARRAHAELVQHHERAEAAQAEAAAASGLAEDLLVILRSGLSEIAAGSDGLVRFVATDGVSLEDLSALGRTVSALAEAAEVVAEAQGSLDAHTSGSDEAVDRAAAAVGDAATAAAAASREAPASGQLASIALDLLGQRCPVCDQPIDEADVRSRLENLLSESQAAVVAARATQDQLASAEATLREAQAAAARRRKAADDVAAARAELEQRAQAGAGTVVVDLNVAADRLAAVLQDALAGLRSLYRVGQERSGARFERLRGEADALRLEVDTSEKALATLERRIGQAKQLERAASEASKRIVERALQALQPSFAEVFDRLRPNVAFTELDVRQDVMANKNQVVPVVRDVARGVSANPSLVFSEGQLNVVALSYFLGMALNAREAALPFLVLDDPLQALDVIAILGFSDLCRRLRAERQLIVTTHDRRFADVLVRKLSPRDATESLIVHHFEGWTREGPVVSTLEPEAAEIVPLLRAAS